MARKVHNYAKWTDQEWQEYRQKQRGLGGSDIATVLGVNKYKSPRRLWAELTGAIEREDISHKPAVKMGHKLEPVVADLFKEETGLQVRRNNWILQHDTIDYLFANIDREVILPDGERAVLEIKTANVNMRKEWTSEQVPMQYMAQVQYYLMITGYKKAFMAVLIGGVDFDYWEIERNEGIIKQLEAAASVFWEKVQQGIEPEMDGSEDAANLLLESFKEAEEEKTIDLPEKHAEKVDYRKLLQQQKKDIEQEIRQIDNYFKDQIGKGNAIAATVGGHVVKWGFAERKEVDLEKIKEVYPDLYEQWQEATKEFITVKQSRRISYKGA
jgi:putative phage-type endonuclease